MAAITDTGGAQLAPRGVMRALLRLVVLSGLVVTGWLLGSGISHADEDPEQPGIGLVQLVSDRVDRATAPDARSDDRVDMPPAVRSTVKKALSTARMQRLPVQPPVTADAPRPADVVEPKILRPLAPVLKPVTRTVSESIPATQPQAPASKAAAVPPAAPIVQASAVSVAVPTAGPADGPTAGTVPGPRTGLADIPARTSVGEVPTAAPANAAADTADGLPAPGDGPASPVPASPLGSTTAPSLTGSSGGGAGAKGVPIVAVHDTSTTAGLTPTHRLRYLGAGDLPRSPAAEPSTSPD